MACPTEYSFSHWLVLQDQRVPADMVFVRTTEKSGSCFIRTDQLDGETDWKLRLAVQNTQNLHSNVVRLLDCIFTGLQMRGRN